ncbi:MAG: hypothetical protein AAF741_13940 [Bacteroidota bacterium]
MDKETIQWLIDIFQGGSPGEAAFIGVLSFLLVLLALSAILKLYNVDNKLMVKIAAVFSVVYFLSLGWYKYEAGQIDYRSRVCDRICNYMARHGYTSVRVNSIISLLDDEEIDYKLLATVCHENQNKLEYYKYKDNKRVIFLRDTSLINNKVKIDDSIVRKVNQVAVTLADGTITIKDFTSVLNDSLDQNITEDDVFNLSNTDSSDFKFELNERENLKLIKKQK